MALLTLLLQAAPGLAEPRLVPGEAQTVTLNPDTPVRLEIDAPAGSYLAGRIISENAGVTADLLTDKGVHFRRLAKDEAGNIRILAMTEGQRMVIQLFASVPAQAEVRLDELIPQGDQLPPAPDYLSPRIARLAADMADGGGTTGFWDEMKRAGTPLVEDAGQGMSVVTFLWQGAARNARLFGGPSSDHDWLERLGSSDVWFKSYLLPNTTRLSFKIAPDVPHVPGDARARRIALLATAQVDPLNKYPWPVDAPDRFNQQATLTLPDAPPQPGTPPLTDAKPVIDTFSFASPTLGNTREITLAHSQDFDPNDPDLVVVLIFDGERAQDQMNAPQMLDSLTRQGDLPPVLAVLIPSLGVETRARELPDNPVFADALADELMPIVAARTGIKPVPARTALAGASYGGLAAATVAMRRPETFGNALSMSGSFWWAPPDSKTDGTPYVAASFAEMRKLPIRFFLSAGTFETSRDGTDGILPTSRALRDILRLKGYDVGWREYAAGHDYLVWRGALADGLIALFGK